MVLCGVLDGLWCECGVSECGVWYCVGCGVLCGVAWGVVCGFVRSVMWCVVWRYGDVRRCGAVRSVCGVVCCSVV